MQWGGGANAASIENKSCGYFHQGVHLGVCPSDFNEWHMLDKESKHVHKWGPDFEEQKELLLGLLVILKPISFAFCLWVRITISRKQDGNWNSKNLASHSAFWGLSGILEEEDGFLCSWLWSPQRGGVLHAAKPAEQISFLSQTPSHAVTRSTWCCVKWLLGTSTTERLSRQVLPLFPFGLRGRGMFLLTRSKINGVQLKAQGHGCWLLLPCVNMYLGCPSC